MTFADFSSWTYVDGLDGMPENVKALSGQRVEMTGLLIPIDDIESREFMLGDREWLRRGTLDVHQTARVVFSQPVQAGRRIRKSCG